MASILAKGIHKYHVAVELAADTRTNFHKNVNRYGQTQTNPLVVDLSASAIPIARDSH